MSEAYMRHIIKNSGLDNKIKVCSRAISNYHIGEAPYYKTREILDKFGIDYSSIVSKQLLKDDLDENDYIIVMDDSNLKEVTSLGTDKKIHKLTDFIENSDYDHVPDPYFTRDFNLTYELVKKGCDMLLKTIISEHKL